MSTGYQQAQTKLAELRKELAKLNQTLTPANPRVQRVQQQIGELTAGMQKEKRRFFSASEPTTRTC